MRLSISRSCILLAIGALSIFGFAHSAKAAGWAVDSVKNAQQVSDGSSGGRVEVCYTNGNKNTVGISFGQDLVFWLVKGSCVHVRNGVLSVSLSGNAESGDNAEGTATLVAD